MIVSLTRLRLTQWKNLGKFFSLSRGAISQAKRDPACVGGATYLGPGLTFWTATLWLDEAAMRIYVNTGSHRETLPWLARLCSEGVTSHVAWEKRSLPKRAELRDLLLRAPKFFRLEHPSNDQRGEKISAAVPWMMTPFK